VATATTESTKPKSDDAVSKALEEYVPPGGSGKTPDITLADIRTADDAQVMFLREEIDEELFSQAVNKFGRPSNGPENNPNRPDLAYERDLPKWAFNPPASIGPSIKERVKAAEDKDKERKEAADNAPDDPYKVVTVQVTAEGGTKAVTQKSSSNPGTGSSSSSS